MRSWRRILVFTKVEHTARRQIVHGIGRYAHQCPGWQPLIPWADLDDWSLPEGLRVDGVVAFPQSSREIKFLLGLKVPVVCVGPHFPNAPLPRVEWDDALAGRLAVTHLIESGLKRIVFVGADFQKRYVSRRLEGARIEAVGQELDFDHLDLEPEGHQTGHEAELTRSAAAWLKDRESPFGIVTATDLTGLDVLHALRTAGIAVPEEAAVISIGGDNVLCPFSEPALSSVVLPGEEVGYEAARLLDAQLGKRRRTKRVEVMVTPQRVAARRSSDVIATEDPVVRQALRFIRDHAIDPIGVRDVLENVPLSRRPLELRFKKATGRTIQKEIWRIRIERAKGLLVETDLSVAEVADRCGFSEPQRMTEVFARELGEPPGAFRQAHRPSPKKQ